MAVRVAASYESVAGTAPEEPASVKPPPPSVAESMAQHRCERRGTAGEIEALFDKVLVTQILHRLERPIGAKAASADGDLRGPHRSGRRKDAASAQTPD